MLLQLTTKCFEQCTHCLVNAKPDGHTMSPSLINEFCRFVMCSQAHTLVITGGEITTDPDFYEKVIQILDYFRGYSIHVILESNGTWIKMNGLHPSYSVSDADHDINKTIANKMRLLMDRPEIIGLQISSHKDFYPNYNIIKTAKENHLFEKIIGRKVLCEIDWQGVATNLKYLGRARNILDKDKLKGNPSCINMLLLSRQLGIIKKQHRIPNNLNNWQTIIYSLETIGHKLCTPMVNHAGDIFIGESQECQSLGNIRNYMRMNSYSMSEELTLKLEQMKCCNRCLVRKNIDDTILKTFKL